MLQLTIGGVADPDLRVRQRGVVALKQLIVECQPEVCHYHAEILYDNFDIFFISSAAGPCTWNLHGCVCWGGIVTKHRPTVSLAHLSPITPHKRGVTRSPSS